MLRFVLKRDALALVKYISEEQKEEKFLANQQVIKTPIVRNGKQATVGYAPEVWKSMFFLVFFIDSYVIES